MRVSFPHYAEKAIVLGLLTLSSLVVGSCNGTENDDQINVGVIGDGKRLSPSGSRLSAAAQHLRHATSEGLVSLDQTGKILPGLAERWHVSPDGLFYTFKIREVLSSDEDVITAEAIKRRLLDAVDQLEGTSLDLDLAKLREVRAMTGRVIELRLSSPMPEFLRLLAQPELTLTSDDAASGPMVLERNDESQFVVLRSLAPELRGLPERDKWQNKSRSLTLEELPAPSAVAKFSSGELDLLINGSLFDLPLADLGPLSRGTIQIDPTQGIFGLAFLNADGLLADPARREALSMAIDREALIEPFGLSGWRSSSFIVPYSLESESPTPGATRWGEVSLEERRAIAADRVRNWEDAQGDEAMVRIRLPTGPGSDQLFKELEQSWRTIGIEAVRVDDTKTADMELRDRVARYSSPRWFLNQFNCSLKLGLCSRDADDLVRSSLDLQDSIAKAELLKEAHSLLTRDEVFIPFGAPVRWALVRGSIASFEPNQWGVHPLLALSQVAN